MPYAIGAGLILAGVVCIGIGFNNNGYILFRAWGQLYKDQTSGAAKSAGAAAPTNALASAIKGVSTARPVGVAGSQPGAAQAAAFAGIH